MANHPPTQPLPRVIFVILNWNQAQMTLECLESLQGLTYPNYAVVVVDNGSTDGSAAAIRAAYPAVTVVENGSNLGYSEGNNAGIRCALQQPCDYIFLLNNDTYVDPRMLTEMVAVAESDPRIGITGPTMLYADPADVLWGGDNIVDLKQSKILRRQMGEKLDLVALRQAKAVQTGYIDSCAILVRRVVFERAGLMDGRFFINFDDVDLNFRARRAGYTIVYVPSAIMWHRVSAAMGVGSPATTYYMTRNALLFFTRHAPGPWKAWGLAKILFQTARTVAAWKLRPAYREAIFRRKAAANLYAVRDFFLGRFGRMGADVARACAAK